MKRCILIETLLALTVVILVILCLSEFGVANDYRNSLETLSNSAHVEDLQDFITIYNQNIVKHSIFGALALVACLFNIVAIIMIAIKDFKPLAAKLTARKQALKETKKQKELEGKQQQLEKLQAEIDNLKNN